MKVAISDTLNFTIESIKKHLGILLIGLLFIFVGCILIYIASLTENPIPLYIFGGVFISFSLFFILYTIPSSLKYYYNQEVIKKHGSFTTAVIINKEIEENSYSEKTHNHAKTIEELNYLLSFSFNYNNNKFENSFYVHTKECFDKLEIGHVIPIKFLKTNPMKASVRFKKLYKELGLKD